MKKVILMMTVALIPFVSFANTTTIPSSEVQLQPSDIDKVVRLVDKKDFGSSHKKLQIIVTDRGMSTDVSPRYSVYLGFASLAEMGNITTNIKINDQAYSFLSASRKAPGIYEVKVVEYRDDGMYEVTQEIDATAIFIDENKMRKGCDDFCDGILKTSVVVKSTAKKVNF